MDQLPESRSIVFSDELPGDFSEGCGIGEFMLAVSVDMEGRVCDEEAGGGCVSMPGVSHGRRARAVSMANDRQSIEYGRRRLGELTVDAVGSSFVVAKSHGRVAREETETQDRSAGGGTAMAPRANNDKGVAIKPLGTKGNDRWQKIRKDARELPRESSR